MKDRKTINYVNDRRQKEKEKLRHDAKTGRQRQKDMEQRKEGKTQRINKPGTNIKLRKESRER